MAEQSIQKIRASRVNNITADEYSGYLGLIWYDTVTGDLRIYNGDPGGKHLTGGGGTGNISVSSQSVPVTANVASFNFIGSAVTTTAIGSDVTVNIPGPGYINFDGGSPANFYVGGPAFDCGGVY